MMDTLERDGEAGVRGAPFGGIARKAKKMHWRKRKALRLQAAGRDLGDDLGDDELMQVRRPRPRAVRIT